jgi:hypothetical protein
MTVLVTVASQSFSPQTQNLAFSVAADATRILVTFTHPDWPEGGAVVRCELLWGGVSAGVFETSGGLIRDKAGTPIGGTTITTLQVSKPPGFTGGTARVQVLQTFTSAILVESF